MSQYSVNNHNDGKQTHRVKGGGEDEKEGERGGCDRDGKREMYSSQRAIKLSPGHTLP